MNGGRALDTAGATPEAPALAAFASPRTVRPPSKEGESRPACPVHRSPHPGTASSLRGFRLCDALTARARPARGLLPVAPRRMHTMISPPGD